MNADSVVLHTEALSIGYQPARQAARIVAHDIELTLRAGELVCLLGPNGAGKSTLLRTLGGLQKPLAGRALLLGQDVRTLSARQRATRLSLVLTERPHLGLLNGYALVALGRHPYTDWMGRLSRHDEAVIHWAVEAVGAQGFAHQPIMAMSDGQRQRLMIARALAQEAALIVLDEPTAFLDLPRRVETMHLLRHLAQQTGRAILLSTHDLELALRSADQVWLMAEGRVQSGAPEDLVMSGAFEAAFHSEGLRFDRSTGSFYVERSARGQIAVVGEGMAQTWTAHALQRAGFALGEPAAVQVAIGGDEARPLWHVQRQGQRTTYESIGALLAGLNQA